jgi:hypothetical protein
METDPHDLNRLAAYVEGRLAEAESADVAAHLSACVDCRTTLAAYARAIATDGARQRPVATRHAAMKWLPIAAMLAIGTVAGIMSLAINRPQPIPPAGPRPDVHLPPPAVVQEAPPPAPASGARPDRDVLTKRGAQRTVAGKVFRLESGEWIDASYDRFALLPVVDAAAARDKAALLARVPALRPYAALGEKVLVVHEGTVYRIGPFSAARL